MNFLPALLTFLASFTISMTIIPLIIRYAHSRSIFDAPDSGKKDDPGRRVHSVPTPRLGGLAFIISYSVSVLLFSDPLKYWAVLVPSLLLFATGFIDDLRPLPALLRLGVQLGASLFTVIAADLELRYINFFPFFYLEVPYLAGVIISVFIITGAVNAVNMIDGLDGLAGGVVIIGIFLLGYLRFIQTQDLTIAALFHLPIIAAILGFLRYNTHPAVIFMGDGGSNWLGFISGVLILFELNYVPSGSAEIIQRPAQILSILMAFSIPVFDTAFVILKRLSQGKSPFFPDQNHFHHGLLKLGLNQSQAVTFIYFISIAAGILGSFPVLFGRPELWWIPLLSLFILLTIPGINYMQAGDIKLLYFNFRRLHLQDSGFRTFFSSWERINRYIIYTIFFFTPFAAVKTPGSVGYAAAAVAAALIFLTLIPVKRTDFLDSAFLAAAVTVILTANNMEPIWIEFQGNIINIRFIYNILFLFLLVSSAFYMVLTLSVTDLIITPTDFLMILLPLVLLLAPQSVQSDFRLQIIGIRTIILFLALRTVIRREKKFLYRIRLVAFGSLIYIMLSGLFGFRFIT